MAQNLNRKRRLATIIALAMIIVTFCSIVFFVGDRNKHGLGAANDEKRPIKKFGEDYEGVDLGSDDLGLDDFDFDFDFEDDYEEGFRAEKDGYVDRLGFSEHVEQIDDDDDERFGESMNEKRSKKNVDFKGALEEEEREFTERSVPLQARKCARAISMKPIRRLDDLRACKEEREKYDDYAPIAVVGAIHARSLMKIGAEKIVKEMRDSFGDEREKKSELHSDGEVVLAVYGVNLETEIVLKDLEEILTRENDFFLAIVDGDIKALNEISDYDDAIARALKFSRARFAIVADMNFVLPKAEWTKMALLKVFRTEPQIAAVLFGGNEKVSSFEGVRRPSMVLRNWEAAFALEPSDQNVGCQRNEKSVVAAMVEKGMEFKRLPRKLKRLITNNNTTKRDERRRRRSLLATVADNSNNNNNDLDIMNGKWETNSNRGGVEGAFDLGCKSPSKKVEKKPFCSGSGAQQQSNKKHRRIQASFIMQYFNRAKTLGEIFDALAQSVLHSSSSSSSSKKANNNNNSVFTMEVLVNVDSGYKISDNWIEHALNFKKQTNNRDAPFVLAFSNDIHELRGYNRLAKVATSEFLVFAQDDDKPDVTDKSSLSWLVDGLSLMRRHRELALLGAYRGRYDDGTRMKKSSNQNDGSKFGGNFESDRETRPIAYVDTELGIPFLWMYKVNMGPMLFKRSIFLSSGGFHDQFSCPGEMAQGFDFEISVRMWSEGFKVGLYDPKWKHRVDKDLKDIGNQNRHRDVQKKELTDAKDEATRRNNENIYKLFKKFHHEKGTKLAKKSLKEDLGKKNLFCALPKAHELCASSFLETPRDTVTCMSADRKCFQRKYIEKHNVAGVNDDAGNLPKDENGDIDVSKIQFTKGEKVRFKYEWLEHDGAQRVWNEALVETQKIALETANRNSQSSETNNNKNVEDAVKAWLNENMDSIQAKVEQVRVQLAKEAEPELKRAEELAAKGLIYGTGGAVSEDERAKRTKAAKFVDKKVRDTVVDRAGIHAFNEGKEDRAAWE